MGMNSCFAVIDVALQDHTHPTLIISREPIVAARTHTRYFVHIYPYIYYEFLLQLRSFGYIC